MVAALLLAFVAGFARAAVVEEITRLYPVAVDRVVAPRSIEEVQELVRRHPGPVSIGGGRFSMGGQTATEDALQLDMRRMDRVLEIDEKNRTVRVQAGATWRKLQEALDPKDLSLKIMQSYANFTVGGSLSVNVHGRYVNQGPLVRAVRSIRLVLADGSLVEASPAKNRELFYGAIGGYGGLGVIVEAVLDLEKNEPLERTYVAVPVAEYRSWFAKNVKGSKTAVFHNADIIPPNYETANALTFSRTDRPVTIEARLQPQKPVRLFGRAAAWAISELPGGGLLHGRVLQPFMVRGKPVVWRNYEASYDVSDLEPTTRRWSTYVLQEYFVPVGRFEEFVPKMAEIFTRYKVNVLNVSIRHAQTDPGTLMAWARGESFAFVVYYKQGTDPVAREEVGLWTRELVDAVVSVGGTYYLPYQPLARLDQFLKAYPRAPEFFALKKRVDPSYKFRNKLWDKYLPPPKPAPAAAREVRRRPEEQSVLTLPEWYVVFSAEELASWLKTAPPSGFPWLRSVGQFWRLYAAAMRAGPRNPGYQVMEAVVGASFTAEYVLAGLYEGTAGRLLAGSPSPEDALEGREAAEYARFIHDVPWYEFGFGGWLRELWRVRAPWTARRLERRVWLTAQLAGKAAWAKAIKRATGAAYAPEDLELDAVVRGGGKGERVLRLPRYEGFTRAVPGLAGQGLRFVEISGNRRIAATFVAPREWDGGRLWGEVVAEWPILTSPGKKRVAVVLPVRDLSAAVLELPKKGVELDHVYDY